MAVSVIVGLGGVVRADDVTQRVQKLEQQVAELTGAGGRSIAEGGVQIHGYGELHYNNLSGKGGAADKEEIDFHRFVLFFGYEFTDRIRFNSEFELEHSLAGESKPGEVELEQAYLDFDLSDSHTARAGLFLVPVGLLNPTHEPPRFYGVERNPVENNILPTTWWEAGAGMQGDIGAGWRYEAYLHSGLNTSTGSTYAVRAGRQKVAQATASDPAATLALNWSIPGGTLGGAVNYQSDITQGADSNAGEAWLGEVHADLRRGPFGLRALYAEWALAGEGPKRMDADRQLGWYVEPSYRVTDSVGVFARYGEWDNQAGSSDTASLKRQWDAGVNWWPHNQVVVKADYQWQDNTNGKDQNGFNLGVGYEF
jgi:phosphate-selective porin